MNFKLKTHQLFIAIWDEFHVGVKTEVVWSTQRPSFFSTKFLCSKANRLKVMCVNFCDWVVILRPLLLLNQINFDQWHTRETQQWN